jgi:DNA ligase-1
MLSTRQVTGDEAKNLVVQFLIDHDILSQDREIREDRKEELEIFGRILDRNLVAGFGARTLSSINWGEPSSIDPVTANPRSSEGTARLPLADMSSQEGGDSVVPPQRSLKAFPVALGKAIDPPFAEIAKSSCKWYASRKLDGVRVITFLEFRIPHQGQMSLHSARFFSRTGKPFTSLDKVEKELSILEKYPNVQDWLMGDGSIIESTEEGVVKRVVLDGEVCVMREKKSQSGKRIDEETAAGTIWSDSDLEEDFASTVSEIRRGPPFTIPHPVYFLFDILPFGLFDNAKGASTFGKRVADIRNLGDWLATQETGEKILRPLAQWEVEDGSDIDSMVARAAEEGWEGLVLRADKPYKGSRSSVSLLLLPTRRPY